MKVKIPLDILQQIQNYVKFAAPYEVTGIGTVKVVPGQSNLAVDGRSIRNTDDFLVSEVFLPSQHSSTGYCRFADDALNNIILHVMEDSPERAAELRFRWHSHGNGSVFWSPIDEADISDWRSPWLLSLVTNVQGEYLLRLDTFDDLRLTLHDLTLEVILPEDPNLKAIHRREITDKVRILKEAPYEKLQRPNPDLQP